MVGSSPRSEENPYYSLERIMIESLKKRIRRMRRMGLGLSFLFMMLWFATMVLVRARPDWLGLMPIAICR